MCNQNHTHTPIKCLDGNVNRCAIQSTPQFTHNAAKSHKPLALIDWNVFVVVVFVTVVCNAFLLDSLVALLHSLCSLLPRCHLRCSHKQSQMKEREMSGDSSNNDVNCPVPLQLHSCAFNCLLLSQSVSLALDFAQSCCVTRAIDQLFDRL